MYSTSDLRHQVLLRTSARESFRSVSNLGSELAVFDGCSRRKRRSDTPGIHTLRQVTDLVRLIQEKDESDMWQLLGMDFWGRNSVCPIKGLGNLGGVAVAKWDADTQFLPYQTLVADHARAGQFISRDVWTAGGLPILSDPQVGAFSPLNVKRRCREGKPTK